MDRLGHHPFLFEISILRTRCAYLFCPVFCSFGWPVVCGVTPVVCEGFMTPVGLAGVIELEAAEVPVVEAGPLAEALADPLATPPD
jgi:hypothetical protein